MFFQEPNDLTWTLEFLDAVNGLAAPEQPTRGQK
jgi:hypothetical protein